MGNAVVVNDAESCCPENQGFMTILKPSQCYADCNEGMCSAFSKNTDKISVINEDFTLHTHIDVMDDKLKS